MGAARDELPYLLTVKQAAELLQLHPETVRLQARDGRLPARKYGRTWRFARDELLTNVTSTSMGDSRSHATSARHAKSAAPASPRLITQREAAETLGVSRDTIARMIQRGDLDAEPTGTRGGALRVVAESATTRAGGDRFSLP